MSFERMKELCRDLESLQNHSILIFGLGGVGSFATEAIARMGFKKLILVDYDTVDETNINRQLYALQSTIGHKKTDIASNRIKDINPTVELTVYAQKVTKENIELFFQEKVDFIVEAIDDLPSKVEIASYAEKNNIPMISSMGFANKVDPSQIEIKKLKQTTVDPLAKKLRYLFKQAGLSLELPVVYSKEQPLVPQLGNTKLGSISFVPSAAGLRMASYVYHYFKGE